jgi:hypothetical protein
MGCAGAHELMLRKVALRPTERKMARDERLK